MKRIHVFVKVLEQYYVLCYIHTVTSSVRLFVFQSIRADWEGTLHYLYHIIVYIIVGTIQQQ